MCWYREGPRNAGTETVDTQVGKWPCAVGGDAGTETEDAQVGEWNRVVAKEGTRVAEGVG